MNTTLNKGTVVIMRSAPGGGKSTFVKKNFPDAFICSADNFFIKDGVYCYNPKLIGEAHEACFDSFLQALKDQKKLIVIDNTNIKVKEMTKYVMKAFDYDYNIRIVRMKVSLEKLLGRNVHGVPDNKVIQMHNNIEDIPDSWGITELFADGESELNGNF